MSAEAIQPVGTLPTTPDLSMAYPVSANGAFSSLLMAGANHVDATLKGAESAVAGFAIDGSAPPHQVMLALEQARLELQFALQVRSKLVEGYQELMRMQI
jgi:flagellar hook-basal body complex protein FliE